MRGHHHARVRKLTGLSLIMNDDPWKVSYMIDTNYPGVISTVGTSYHPTQPKALAAAIEWTGGWAKKEHTMPDQIETRVENIRQYNQEIVENENTRPDDANKADDTLWLIDQLTAARESIRDARAQEHEDQDVARYLEVNPIRPYTWPPATKENAPSLSDQERDVANAILCREKQEIRPVTFPGTGNRLGVSFTARAVSGIMSRYYKDQAQR